MLWKPLALIAAAALLSAAAKPPAPKALAKPAAGAPAKPAPAKLAAPVADFDARYPASVVALLNLGGGKAQIVRQEEDAVLVSVTSVAANFTLQFTACTPQGRACKAVVF